MLVVDRMSTLADISCISNVSMIQTTHLNETSSTTQNRRSTGEFETTVESIDLTKSTSDLFLDGCKVMKSFKEGKNVVTNIEWLVMVVHNVE